MTKCKDCSEPIRFMRVTYYISTPGIEKKGWIVIDASSAKPGDEVFDKTRHVKHQCKKKTSRQQ